MIFYISKLQKPNIRDFCVLVVFRIEGHSLKSGLNEIINILGYKVTPEPVMIHYQDGICSLRRSIFFSFTIPSQINGINHPCRSIPVHTARFPFVDWAVLISYFSKKKVYYGNNFMFTRPEQSSPVQKACRNDRTSHNNLLFPS